MRERKEAATIKEKYKISYGLQYDAWELELRLPGWEEYRTEEDVGKKCGERMVSALLTTDAIFLFCDGLELKILPKQQEIYRFSYLKEDVYERLGPPLSPEDLDRLIEKDMLEEVIFSSRYMLTENDYMKFSGNLSEAYMELGKWKKPKSWKRSSGQELCGYLFESVWYQAECIR